MTPDPNCKYCGGSGEVEIDTGSPEDYASESCTCNSSPGGAGAAAASTRIETVNDGVEQTRAKGKVGRGAADPADILARQSTRVYLDHVAFGKAVRKYRTHLGIGLSTKLTPETNVNISQHSRVERGLIPNMSSMTLLSLAYWANLKIDDFVRGNKNMTTDKRARKLVRSIRSNPDGDHFRKAYRAIRAAVSDAKPSWPSAVGLDDYYEIAEGVISTVGITWPHAKDAEARKEQHRLTRNAIARTIKSDIDELFEDR